MHEARVPAVKCKSTCYIEHQCIWQVDLHTPNLEAATLDWQGQGTSSLFFLPGNMETADAQLTAEGRWLFRCRVADHVGAGMEVRPAAAPLLASLLITDFMTIDIAPAGAMMLAAEEICSCTTLFLQQFMQRGAYMMLFRPCS
jgi:hypothetical protein